MNYYEYLGISPTASQEEIRKAFRTLAKTKHPDYNKNHTAFWEMVQLNMARDTLLDPSKRRDYDYKLKHGLDTADSPRPTHSSPPKREQKTMYRTIKSLFIYRCKACGLEMSSTWKGYCLYHYLEATNQLNSEDNTFYYGGQVFRWKEPEHRHHTTHGGTINLNSPYFRTMIIVYFILIFVIFTYIVIYYQNQVSTFLK